MFSMLSHDKIRMRFRTTINPIYPLLRKVMRSEEQNLVTNKIKNPLLEKVEQNLLTIYYIK